MFDLLPDDLAAALDGATARLESFARVHYCHEVESTNDLALALAAEGAPEGVSVMAGAQRRGRGRRGHEWFSPPGVGLYLSVIVRPEMAPGPLPLLTIGAGVAMAEAVVATTGLPVELKWPNDLVIGRPWRKVGGVLAEAVSGGERISAVVVGMGMNVKDVLLPASIATRASSLETEVGHAIDRPTLAVELLSRMREVMSLIHANDRAALTDRWRRYARTGLGGAVRWRDIRGEHHGVARDIDDEGALLVTSGGVVERVMAGAVSWERLSGE